MVRNECGEETGYNAKELQSIYGPYKQTLFLGCSVLSFSASAGWNGQNSEVSVDLARDACESPAGHYKELWTDEFGNVIFTDSTPEEFRTTTNPDPGFTYPNIGAPVYFRVANFEYSGIIQGWTVKEGSDGNPVFSVKIVDPRVILDNVQVILDNYEGSLYDSTTRRSVYNLLNVYGYLEWTNGKGGPADENTGVAARCQDYIAQHGGSVADALLNVSAVAGGTGFGAPAGGFGGARKTDRGISWNYIKAALQDMAGCWLVNPNAYFSQGGVFFRPGSGRGYGELNSTVYTARGWSNFSSQYASEDGVVYQQRHNGAKYIIDLTDLPDAQWDYRIAGPVVSLSELINQVCADAGCDYYVELIPMEENPLNPSYIENPYIRRSAPLVIKVRTISRFNQPTLGVSTGEITSFISKYNILTGDPGYGIVNDSFGRELRSDVNTSFIIGAKARQYYEEQNQTRMTPFWGYDADGGLLMSHNNGEDIGWKVRLDFRKVNLALHNPISLGLEGNTFGWVYENELRWALGDLQNFQNMILRPQYPDTPIKRYLVETLQLGAGEVNRGTRGDNIDPSTGGDVRQAAQNNRNNAGVPGKTYGVDVKTFFNWLQSYTSDVYGKQFLFQAPYLCTSRDEDSKERIFSDEPSTEGGWPSLLEGGILVDNPNVLGINNPSLTADFFKDDVGKFEPIVQFTGTGLNTASLGTEDYIAATAAGGIDFVWCKATIEAEWVEGTPYSGVSDTNIWSALLKISAPVKRGDLEDFVESNTAIVASKPRGPLPYATGAAQMNTYIASQSKQSGGTSLAAAFPIGAGVPVKSNTRTYGPWINVGANPGAVHCEIDDGLAPWEYGSIGFMNKGGLAKVLNASTNMQVGERGEVTIPGYPIISLGSALQANPPDGSYGARRWYWKLHYWANRVSRYDYVWWQNPPFSRTAPGQGASVSNINVTVGAGGVTTSYTISTFTPVFGRFAKSNADRVKQIGLNKLQAERDSRAKNALKRLLKAAQGRASIKNVSDNIGSSALAEKSATVLLAGQLQPDPKRKTVVGATQDTLVYFEDYDNTAMMSMDGLLRPISNYGDGGLPSIATNSGTCAAQGTQTDSPPPPVAGYTGLPILQKYLDFLADPVSNPALFNTGSGSRSSGSTSGHDVESVARETMQWLEDNQPGGTDSMLLHVGGATGSYASDYRYLALRGPMVMQGWGYDIHGKPIPNAAGDTGGSFQSSYEGLKDQFKENWLSDARTWPAAPVDLRFDRKRGVWTVPPAFRMYQVENKGDSIGAGATGAVGVIKYTTDLYDEKGSLLSNPEILVENWTKETIASGDKGLAYYDTADCKYWFIPSASGGSNVGVACSERIATDCGGVIGSGGFDSTPNYSGWSNFIEWGQGLSISGISFSGNSGILVSASGGATKMCITSEGGCGGTGMPDLEASGYDCITFQGFKTLAGSGSCCESGSGASSGLSSLAILGPTISGYNNLCGNSGVDGSGGVGGTGTGVSGGNFFSHLTFGNNLTLSADEDVDGCAYRIDAGGSLTVSNSDEDFGEFGPNITGITLRTCGGDPPLGGLIAAGGSTGCGSGQYDTVSIGVSGWTDNITLVSNVFCSGDSLGITKVELNFCDGLLVGTGEP